MAKIRACSGISSAFESPGIVAAIPTFVMVAGYVEDWMEIWDRLEQVIGVDRMLAHDLPIIVIQPLGFEQDRVPDTDLADVVQECAVPEIDHPGLIDIASFDNPLAV